MASHTVSPLVQPHVERVEAFLSQFDTDIKIDPTYNHAWASSPFNPDNEQFLDFKEFLRYLWVGVLKIPHPTKPGVYAEPTAVQLDIADYLINLPSSRVIIEAFRGVGKSWITSAFVMYLLWLYPSKKIMVASASEDRAKEFVRFTLETMLVSSLLKHLGPGKSQRRSAFSFDCRDILPDHTPSVKAYSVTGSMAGARADIIVGDDVEIPRNSWQVGMRERIREVVREFESILKPGGSICYLGTPQVQETLYGKLEASGYQVRIWPALYPSLKRLDTYAGRLAPFIEEAVRDDPSGISGKAMEPMRFPVEELDKKRLSQGDAHFMLQFMLDTSQSDADMHPMKLRDVPVVDFSNEMAPEVVIPSRSNQNQRTDLPVVGYDGDRWYQASEWLDNKGRPAKMTRFQRVVMGIDPSGSGTDETGWCVVGLLNGRMFLLDAGGFRGVGYSDEVVGKLVGLAKKYKVNQVYIEHNFGAGMFTTVLRPAFNRTYRECELLEVKVSNQMFKDARIIDQLAPLVGQHVLCVRPDTVLADTKSTQGYPDEESLTCQLFYQMTHISANKGSLPKYDRVDVLAMVAAQLIEDLGIDDQEVVLEDRAAALEEWVRAQDERLDGVLWGPNGGAVGNLRDYTDELGYMTFDDDGQSLVTGVLRGSTGGPNRGRSGGPLGH